MAMLGLVSTKVPRSRLDDLRRRIDEAAKHADISQLGICPQCGFASNVFGNPVTIDDERRKLAPRRRHGQRGLAQSPRRELSTHGAEP
jgi:5-methyltetrahydropteroyltriglutamate--homocysteine methyltransferase